MTLWIHGLGHFHPDSEITNRFLEELDIGTSHEWIVERVGILSRRTVLPLDYIRATRNRDPRAAVELLQHSTAEMSAHAARMAIHRAGIERSAIGLVIAGSCAPDILTPADACNVACLLELEVPAFDLTSACTSFLAQLWMLSRMEPTGLPPYVLVVVADSLTKAVDYSDRSTAVLFGDAAAAAVVSTRVPGRARVLGADLRSSPRASDKVAVPRLGFFAQEGRTVQSFAIRRTALEFERLRAAHATGQRPLHFVGHQANLRMLQSVCQRCGIPPERHHSNVEWYGNTAAPSSASVLSMSWDKWGPSDDVAVVTVGAGLSWSSALLQFGDAS